MAQVVAEPEQALGIAQVKLGLAWHFHPCWGHSKNQCQIVPQ
jgi:hypothetical protein